MKRLAYAPTCPTAGGATLEERCQHVASCALCLTTALHGEMVAVNPTCATVAAYLDENVPSFPVPGPTEEAMNRILDGWKREHLRLCLGCSEFSQLFSFGVPQ